MAGVTFASKLRDDGTLAVPSEAVEALGVRPGDELRVRVEAREMAIPPRFLADALKDVLAAAEELDTTAGKVRDDPDERELVEIIRRKHRDRGLDV